MPDTKKKIYANTTRQNTFVFGDKSGGDKIIHGKKRVTSLSLSLSKTNISQDDHPQHNIHCRV